MKPSQESYVPTFPGVLAVEFKPGEFNSGLRSLKSWNAGETIVPLGGNRISKGPKAYTSVQCGSGPNDHIELNSDLVYINHSCDPNVAFDLSSSDSSKWHLKALNRIEKDEYLTFFYPSTEWDMDQAFRCQCGARNCVGIIKGAKYLLKKDLQTRRFVSPWILELAKAIHNK
ncbi:hypothetical protein M422DRAFT_213317 [Sphaerobolus stellatus SS14]|uniref:Unplaced genomic scaffold SPHSTscaffold_131, whole genome shotgun sequence n=1 Tax=Sphaerobolus stellatus (strain SS14) TaxID=990650 RepID=A0A0C9V9L2_SPHS4|nr:hypothetical protein M422DRAFT_213317 [Sphaerobolus stellatus SS14]